MHLKSFASLVAGTVVIAAPVAHAGTRATPMGVSVVVNDVCRIATPSQAIPTANQVQVQCPVGTAYSVGVTPAAVTAIPKQTVLAVADSQISRQSTGTDTVTVTITY